jgi:hypothetical protein
VAGAVGRKDVVGALFTELPRREGLTEDRFLFG